MQLLGIHTTLIVPGDNLVDKILDGMLKQEIPLDDGDVLLIASKAVSTTQKRLVQLKTIKPSQKARKLAKKHSLEPEFVELVLQESDKICGGVTKVLLTLRDNLLVANAGVDHKNAPKGYAVLWPKHPHKSAEKIRTEILKKTGKYIGVLIVDSRITPLRIGTTGIAIGTAGYSAVADCRSQRDLYGNSLHITRHALADDLASAAHLIMGEADEQIPAVLAKNAPSNITQKTNLDSTAISAEDCLFMSCFTEINDSH